MSDDVQVVRDMYDAFGRKDEARLRQLQHPVPCQDTVGPRQAFMAPPHGVGGRCSGPLHFTILLAAGCDLESNQQVGKIVVTVNT